MKKSAQVPASLVVVLAAGFAATGCASRSLGPQCADDQGRYLPDSACRPGGTGTHWIQRSNVQTGGFGGTGGSGGGGGFFGG